MTTFRRLAPLLLLLIFSAVPASAQTSELGLRAGAFFPLTAGDTFEHEWDGGRSPELGISYELRPVPAWLLRASIDTSQRFGETVEIDGEPVPGSHSRLRLTPLRFGTGWAFEVGGDWSGWIGGGATVLFHETTTGEATDHGNHFGAHVFTGFRKTVEDAFFGVELTGTFVPNAFEDDPVAVLFDEEDLGGVSATLLAGWKF